MGFLEAKPVSLSGTGFLKFRFKYRQMKKLESILNRIDGKGYKAYKDLKGTYKFDLFDLSINHVQGDPFASPSRLSARVSIDSTGFPEDYLSSRTRKYALGDFLTRRFSYLTRRSGKQSRGSGKSGLVSIECGGQEILPRNSVVILNDYIEIRFVVGLPAAGRRILAGEAERLLCDYVPRVLKDTLFYSSLDPDALRKHIEVAEDQEAIRAQLREKGLVAFVANDSILPRASGIDPRPLKEGAIPFVSPESLKVEMKAPNRGRIAGMGIPEGVTLIVGGGYHGKSTLLKCLESGVYDHIPGDGREYVVTVPGAIKIRAEDGRSIVGVDISPFINNLPGNRSTDFFTTTNGSGSTSQAANIMEALEARCDLLLVDEDTSATNFMIRDQRMQHLVAKDKEPITPFIDKVRLLYKDYGISTVLVMGGSGDYLDVADTVILMDNYLPRDVSEEAKEVARKFPTKRKPEGGSKFGDLPSRAPYAGSFDARKGSKRCKIDVRGTHTLLYGQNTIDLSCVEQLVDPAQTRAIGYSIWKWAAMQKEKPEELFTGLTKIMNIIDQEGLDILLPYKAGNLARPRLVEIAAAINRFRKLVVKKKE